MAITPYLYYADVRGAMTFLQKAFGFRSVGRPTVSAEGRVAHAAMKLGRDEIMMGEPGGGYRSPRELGQTTQCQYVVLKGLNKHFERAREAGATIIEEPVDTPYGHRRYGVRDPEGHEWYFAEEGKKKAVRKRAKVSPKAVRKSPKRR